MKNRWTLFIKIQLLVIIILLVSYIAVEIIILNLIGAQMQARFIDGAKNSVALMQSNIETIFQDTTERITYLGAVFEASEKGSQEINVHLAAIGLSKADALNTFLAYDDGTWDIIPPEPDLPVNFDPRERGWYKRAFRSSGVKWSNPYIDAVTGDRVVTGSLYTQLIDSEAVVGMDISLNRLVDIFEELNISENDILVLLNEDDRIIASNRLDYLDLTLEAFRDPLISMNDIITGEVVTDKGLYYFRRLSVSDMRLLVFLPDQDIVGTTKQAQIIMTIVMTLIAIVTILLSQSMTRRVMRPLTALKDVMIESKASGEVILYDENSNDEINVVVKAYNALALHINKQNDEILRMAYEDDLTGLPNRANFIKEAKATIEQKKRMALFYLDLDNFKYVNDTYGHAYGDIVLKNLADGLKHNARDNHFIARLSGDEFGILVTDFEDDSTLDSIGQSLLRIVKQPIYLENMEFIMTGSLGLSCYPDDGEDYETVLSNADIAMYEAKGLSTGRFIRFSEETRDTYMEQLRLEHRLKSSIKNDELAVVYQPILKLKTMEIKGFESLARWNDEKLGPVSPDQFIPIAEKNQFIIELGKYVLTKTIEFGKRLFNQYGKYYELNINVSVVQLQNEGFVDDILEVLAQNKFPSRFLNLEITESLTLETDENILMKLAYLRKEGIQISIDDFGTGYSSLHHMTDLSLTHVKIDRQLILKAARSEEVFQLMKGIVEFAHTMLYKVVAEGIEDDEMEAMVIEMGSDYAQGYKYARPLYEEQLIDLLNQ